MTPERDDLVFSPAEIRKAAWLSGLGGFLVPLLAIGAGQLVFWLLSAQVGALLAAVAGGAAGLTLLVMALDWLFLGWPNRRWRRRLSEKLRRLGELTFALDDPNVYFVGVAHPARAGLMRLETDDEIGFLKVGFEALEYRGDRFSWTVPVEEIGDIELEPVGAGLPRRFQRIRVKFRYGEPFDELLLCAREGDRLTCGNDVTQTLYEALRQRLERRSARRLGADERLDDELSTQAG